MTHIQGLQEGFANRRSFRTNSQTLLSQAEWPEWLLQPVVFENASTQQRDTHIQVRRFARVAR